MKRTNNHGKTTFKVLIEDNWELADLTPADYEAVRKDINGSLYRQYLIKLHTGEVVDTGIIDDISVA